MISSQNLCVIIPVHKSNLTQNERLSLIQCRNILISFDVFLIYPETVNISEYVVAFPELKLQKVTPLWLDSIASYNRMKCSVKFYKKFQQYNYMLTYELDSYIFSSEFEKANAFNHDYIGAPWFKDHANATQKSNIIPGGNSGFSIRNIHKCLYVLHCLASVSGYWKAFRKLGLHRIIRFTLILRLFNSSWRIKGKNVYFFGLISNNQINEDTFWSVAVPQVLKFNIAPLEHAIKFSFEVNPSILFNKNNKELPLGCHAWEKYEKDFWKAHISS
ncbi:DUF5672 family protein [Daejeonella oryzae]|uniref:DUF5672 family protein n=1 Tax=Daejeonella oryzae TaxID=1122943 RepID=UPI00041EA05F|nr:DUF5672 family protein [Daejeonella oryzae]